MSKHAGDIRGGGHSPPADRLRQTIHGDLHEHVVEAIYADAARIAGPCRDPPRQTRPPHVGSRTWTGIVTSRIWGFPIMIAAVHADVLDHDQRGQRALRLAGEPAD